MKKLVLLAFAAVSSGVHAQSDLSITFAIDGGLQILGTDFRELTLDVRAGDTVFAVNGVLRAATGLSTPATGTCFPTNTNGIYCNLQVDQATMNINLQSNLAGTIESKDGLGLITDTAGVRYIY